MNMLPVVSLIFGCFKMTALQNLLLKKKSSPTKISYTWKLTNQAPDNPHFGPTNWSFIGRVMMFDVVMCIAINIKT